MYRGLAERYGWDAGTVSRMTPAQIAMYTGEEARVERELGEQASSGGASRIDPRTGHRVVRVNSPAEATELLERLRTQREQRGNATQEALG